MKYLCVGGKIIFFYSGWFIKKNCFIGDKL